MEYETDIIFENALKNKVNYGVFNFTKLWK